MNGHMLFVPVVLALLQVTSCSCGVLDNYGWIPKQKILEELGAQISSLNKNISNFISVETANLKDVEIDIINQEKEAAAIINQKIDALNVQVAEAKTEAKQNLKIYVCLAKEKADQLVNVRPEVLALCNVSLKPIISEIKSIASLEVNSNTIIPRCLAAHPLSNKNLKACCLDGIDDVNKQMKDVSAEMKQQEEEISSKAAQCIKETSDELQTSVERISKELEECVADSK